MMSTSIILVALLVATTAATVDQDWKNFKTTFSKTYRDAREETKRKEIFTSNVEYIKLHNLLFEKGLSTFTVGINNFSDWTTTEFGSFFPKNKPSPLSQLKNAEVGTAKLKTAPDSLDWRNDGIVTGVTDQGSCGSAWLFAEVTAVESVWAKETGNLYDLSLQQVIDCGGGCGGDLNDAYQSIIDQGGIMSAADYPSSGGGGCKYDEDFAVAHITGVGQIFSLDEQEMVETLYQRGPMSFAMKACRSFQHYQSGLYYDPSCTGQSNHGMLLVGYDMTGDLEKNYWIAKNSWGSGWGEKGYINMRMWKNTANMADHISYPIV